ncbi:MAG: HEPN domain-containing protein [Egibacteraceae bacterium]
MPLDRRGPEDPVEWLNRARSNLRRAAEARLDDVYLEDLCFDAQQAAEKAVKGLLIQAGVRFPYIHDLAALISSLERAGSRIPDEVRQAEHLTVFAVATRYPGLDEPVTEAEYRTALEIATAVVRWAEERIAGG